MYLPAGHASLLSPHLASAPAESPLLPLTQLVPCPSSPSLFLALSPSRILLCTTRTPSVIARIDRASPDLVQVSWLDLRTFVALTCTGHIIYYTLQSHSPGQTPYRLSQNPSVNLASFSPGPGEASDPPGLRIAPLSELDLSSAVPVLISALSPSLLLIATANAGSPSIVLIPRSDLEDPAVDLSKKSLLLDSFPWFCSSSPLSFVLPLPTLQLLIFITEDGHAYSIHLTSFSSAEFTSAKLFYTPSESSITGVCCNPQFSLIVLGLSNGDCVIFSVTNFQGNQSIHHSRTLSFRNYSLPQVLHTGKVTTLAWTSDGYALVVGWEFGWSVWSTYGRIITWSVSGKHAQTVEHLDQSSPMSHSDLFAHGIISGFWGIGDTNLFLLARSDIQEMSGKSAVDHQLYIVPFAKSAIAQSPDNTNYPLLHLDDRLLIYRGNEQPDLSVINPQSDVWKHIQVSPEYISINWPIRYTSISSDGKLVAVAGVKGFAYFNFDTRHWNTFADLDEEASFSVSGGMHWFEHRLIVPMEQNGNYWMRIFSIEKELSLDPSVSPISETFKSPISLCSVLDNALLVYTQDNTLHHFLMYRNQESAADYSKSVVKEQLQASLPESSRPHFKSHHNRRVSMSYHQQSSGNNGNGGAGGGHSRRKSSIFNPQQLERANPVNVGIYIIGCGSIGFEGVVQDPKKVRGMSWLIPKWSIKTGDPADDLNVASIILLIEGKLVLLRPQKAAEQEVKYDLQVLSDHIEFFWTHHISMIEPLVNSLWGWDGGKIRVWLDALTVDTENWTGKRQPLRRPHGRQRSASTGDILTRRDYHSAPSLHASNDESTADQHLISKDQGDISQGHIGSVPTQRSESVAGAWTTQAFSVQESLQVPLDFYPLSVLTEMGIIIGVHSEISLKGSSHFSTFRILTSSRLFLHRLLRVFLLEDQRSKAIDFAKNYKHLVYFSHVLEMLLHEVLEEEASDKNVSTLEEEYEKRKEEESEKGGENVSSLLLPKVTNFLSSFPEYYLQVIVNCARKTELSHWKYLFNNIPTSPNALFERCITQNNLNLASSYLIILHNIDNIQDDENEKQQQQQQQQSQQQPKQEEEHKEEEHNNKNSTITTNQQTFRLLRIAIEKQHWDLCKELLRFLSTLDSSGKLLVNALEQADSLPPGFTISSESS